MCVPPIHRALPTAYAQLWNENSVPALETQLTQGFLDFPQGGLFADVHWLTEPCVTRLARLRLTRP